MLGPWGRPVVYLSERLHLVAGQWLPCLRIIAAATLLVKDAYKLTLGQEFVITTLHAIEEVFKQPPDGRLSKACMAHN